MSYFLLRPLLFGMDAEQAHDTTLRLLDRLDKMCLLSMIYPSQAVPTECMGLHLPNPVGLAAGLDKNGAYIDALAELGFGFLEVGTVTPRPQKGNDKPRLFRIKQAGGIINRMGFNNDGIDNLINNIRRAKYKGVLGINIGKNADTPVECAIDDYIIGLQRAYLYADYITINISSPNTKNLRSLQTGNALTELLDGIKTCQMQLAQKHQFYVPIAVKIAPDLDDLQIHEIARTVMEFEIDGLIATNTSLSRVGVEEYKESQETGGLSGRPISHASTTILEKFAAHLNDSVDLIGVGGIDTGERAVNKIKAGAKAIQLYSGLVYEGPSLIRRCIQSIADYEDLLSRNTDV